MPLLLPSILIDSEYVYSLPKWIILIFQLIHNVFCASVNVFFNLLNSMKDKKKVPMITDPLLLKSAVECGRLIREGRLTSTLLVNAYIKRQQEVNHLLNAVAVENYEFALKKAAETDLYISTLDKKSDEFKNLKDKPLLGVPFTLKCSIKAFGYNPTASIVALNNRPPMNEECPLVSSLKNAGALIICYSTCPELRWNIETNSKLYGRCCNPYDVRRTSGASSSGEGSIIGAGASLMGIGSDIAGSIRIPAAFCGIFSYKPSSKALNGEGHEPGAPEGAPVLEMAHIGPMARYAQDLHFMTKLMMTKDKLEELKMNEKVEFKDLKFFYIKDFSYMESEKVSDDMLLGLDSVVKMINAEGNSICEIVLDELKHANEMAAFQTYMDDDFESFFSHMTDHGKVVKQYLEILKNLFGFHSDHELGVCLWQFEQKTLRRLSKEKTKRYWDLKEALKKKINKLLSNNGVLIIPSWPTTSPYHNQLKFNRLNIVYTGVWNALGLPVVTAPIMLSPKDQLPVSIQIVAATNNERLLFEVAKVIEKKLGGWREPL